jgi:hypothetical protein
MKPRTFSDFVNADLFDSYTTMLVTELYPREIYAWAMSVNPCTYVVRTIHLGEEFVYQMFVIGKWFSVPAQHVILTHLHDLEL